MADVANAEELDKKAAEAEARKEAEKAATKKAATPLHDAAEVGDLAATKQLLKKKHDPDQLDGEQKTAMQCAAKKGHISLIKALLKAGGSPDIPDHKGRTALQEAAKRGHIEIIQLLVKKGADAGRLDSKGSSPLHESCKKGHVQIMKALMAKGADRLLNHQNYKGLTPLHEAGRKGQGPVAKKLLKMGADPDSRDIHGNRPAVLAEAFGFSDVAEILGGLNEEEMAEAKKIALMEDVKMSAKGQAMQRAADRGLLLPVKAEMKGASLNAVRAFLSSHSEGASQEDIDAAVGQSIEDFLTEFMETHDEKGKALTPEELAERKALAEAAAEGAAEAVEEVAAEMAEEAVEEGADEAVEEASPAAQVASKEEELSKLKQRKQAELEKLSAKKQKEMQAIDSQIAELEEECSVLAKAAEIYARETK
ncbi:MAG: ankyrin repeat domain-containing protein [Magnetococcales bacterium]|nr:ankyrin repeat domain-containing protein [Magnetococcales bacterium]